MTKIGDQRSEIKGRKSKKNLRVPSPACGRGLGSKPNFGFAYGVDRFAGLNYGVSIPLVRT
jgi:hypothetical protein